MKPGFTGGGEGRALLQGDNEIQGVAQVQAQWAGNPRAVQAGGTRNTVVAMKKTEQKDHPGNRNLDSESRPAPCHTLPDVSGQSHFHSPKLGFTLKMETVIGTSINIAAPWGPSGAHTHPYDSFVPATRKERVTLLCRRGS